MQRTRHEGPLPEKEVSLGPLIVSLRVHPAKEGSEDISAIAVRFWSREATSLTELNDRDTKALGVPLKILGIIDSALHRKSIILADDPTGPQQTGPGKKMLADRRYPQDPNDDAFIIQAWRPSSGKDIGDEMFKIASQTLRDIQRDLKGNETTTAVREAVNTTYITSMAEEEVTGGYGAPDSNVEVIPHLNRTLGQRLARDIGVAISEKVPEDLLPTDSRIQVAETMAAHLADPAHDPRKKMRGSKVHLRGFKLDPLHHYVYTQLQQSGVPDTKALIATSHLCETIYATLDTESPPSKLPRF